MKITAEDNLVWWNGASKICRCNKLVLKVEKNRYKKWQRELIYHKE